MEDKLLLWFSVSPCPGHMIDQYRDMAHVPVGKFLQKLRMRRASLYVSLSDGLYLFPFYLSILDMCGPIKRINL